MEYEIVVAVNHLRDDIKDLSSKIESLSKSPSHQLNRKYLDDKDVCKILHVSERTLYKMRIKGELPFYRIGRKILYQASDIHLYMESKIKEREERFKVSVLQEFE